jgi:NAD(P)-dependent dehydrogenase (short-subunit alcohol dehydrogenase family)
MAKNGFKVLGSDMHIVEPADLWERYIDPAYKAQAPRGLRRHPRDLAVQVAGHTFPPANRSYTHALTPIMPQQQDVYAAAEARHWDSTSQVIAMDAEGIDLAVLFPSRGLFTLGTNDLEPGLAAYCATKGAVHALTRAMACDHGPEGIRVNAICPGYVDTPMLKNFFRNAGDIATLEAAVRGVHPMRRYGTPDDVANLVNWLASDEARYASGQLWVLDGALTAQVQQMRL